MTCSFCHTPLAEQSRFCTMCGADLSDPEVSTRQRAVVKELFEVLRAAVSDRYRIADMLGRGGMGAVFLAEDLRLGRMVAIKVLLPELADDAAFVGRFEREARIAARLDHPNIIPVHAVEQFGDFHYFVMKYVAGKSIDELLTGKALPVEQSRDILWQAACGLGHAHQRGVIHRDVKPSNLMLEEDGRLIITDFGISKALQSDTQYTSTGQMIGTPRYMSPEQALGMDLDGRSDQYSLAAVGYQMLTGRLPLSANTVHALMYKHIHEMPTAARVVCPHIPSEISKTLQRALSKQPDERFATMEDFATAVWPERPVRSGGPGSAGPVPRASRWRRVLVGLMAGLVGIIGLATLWDRHVAKSVMPQPTAARTESGARSPIPPARDTAGVDAGDTVAGGAATSVAPDSQRSQLPTRTPAPAAGPPPATPDRKTASPAKPPVPERNGAALPPAAPATPSIGYVTINAVPYGSVMIDGLEVGDTPVVRYQLPPGTHKIRIAREGFRPESATVTITSGNEVRFSRTLLKESR